MAASIPLCSYPFDCIVVGRRLNDPNGPVYDPVHELYHLFYQYKTPREWGHAVSSNLIDWVQLPVALNLNAWYDSGGDFSGSASILDDETQTVVLTVSSSSGHIFTSTPLNRSDPYLTEWVYSDDTDDTGTSQPLFTPDNLSRDPTELLVLSDGGYQMFVGTVNGTALWQVDSTDKLYALDAWYNPGFALNNNNTPGIFWECPDMFRLFDEEGEAMWVSKYSLDGLGDYFFTGQYDSSTGVFTPGSWPLEQPQRYDSNDLFYASKSFLDAAEDRRVLWGWLHMQPWPIDPVVNQSLSSAAILDDDIVPNTTDWQNAMGVPRLLQLNNEGASLTTYPIPELETLRDASSHQTIASTSVSVDSPSVTQLVSAIDSIHSVRMDVTLQVTSNASDGYTASCGLRLFLDVADASARYLDVTVPYDSNFNGVPRPMRVLVDGCIVEAFFDNGDTSLGTARTFFHFPQAEANNGAAFLIDIVGNGDGNKQSIPTNGPIASCTFTDVNTWEMVPFNFDASLVM